MVDSGDSNDTVLIEYINGTSVASTVISSIWTAIDANKCVVLKWTAGPDIKFYISSYLKDDTTDFVEFFWLYPNSYRFDKFRLYRTDTAMPSVKPMAIQPKLTAGSNITITQTPGTATTQDVYTISATGGGGGSSVFIVDETTPNTDVADAYMQQIPLYFSNFERQVNGDNTLCPIISTDIRDDDGT